MGGLTGLLMGTVVYAAIIGVDDRREWHESSAVLRRAGRAVGALVSAKSGYLEGDRWSVRTPTHGGHDRLCSDVRFREQPSPADCSGFLAGPDVFVTASHCVRDEAACADFRIVFDFAYGRPGVLARPLPWRVFACRAVVARDVEADWVALKLDRPARGRRWLPVRRDAAPAGTPLAMLGFPRGVPLKIAAGATVLAENTHSDPRYYFEAMLDSFGGNSGAPVVDERTGVVQGILTVAFGEFEEEVVDPATGKACRRMRHFPDLAEATPPWVSRAEGFARWVSPPSPAPSP